MQGQEHLEAALKNHQRGRLSDAERGYQHVLALDPNNVDALHLLGVISQQQGRPETAIQLISKAIELNPRAETFYSNLGNAQRDLKRYAEAEAAYKSALALNPHYQDAMINMAALYVAIENSQKALEWAERALTLGAHAHALTYRGVAKKNLKQLDAARIDLEAAVQLNPNLAHSWTNLGNIYRDLCDYPAALIAHDRAVQLQPTLAEAWNNRGYVLKQMGRYDEAMKSYERATEIQPGFSGAVWNKSMIELHRGDWKIGFEHYEFRRKKKGAFESTLPIPEWTGQDLTEKRILVFAEQGMGDIFQFIRLLKLLTARGAKVSFACPTNLHPLLRSFDSGVELVGYESITPDYNFQIPLMSLPQRLGLMVSDVKTPRGYLQIPAAKCDYWKSRLSEDRKFKVGLCWQGNPEFPEDRLRSIPLKAFEPLMGLENISIYSLQRGFGSEQIVEAGFQSQVVDYTGEFDQDGSIFLDAAALMKNLDLTISIDSSLAHLGGAINEPTWILLPKICDWRWGLEGHDRTWYDSVTLIRQNSFFDWNEVIARVAERLQGI